MVKYIITKKIKMSSKVTKRKDMQSKRGEHMASITRIYNKKGELISYQIRVYRGEKEKGKHNKPFLLTYKPPKEATTKQKEQLAAAAAVEFERKCKMGFMTDIRMTLKEFIPIYIDTMENILSPSTMQFYKRNINDCIIPFFGNIKLKEISVPMVQKYITELCNKTPMTRGIVGTGKISPATVRRYLTVFQSIMKQAFKQGYIEENPAKTERLTMPKQLQPKIEIFSKSEVELLLAYLDKEPLQYKVLIYLAIFTGARRGELVALKFSDIDFVRKKMTIERAAIKIKGEKTIIKPPKDNEVRTISLNPYCIDIIEKLQKEKEQIKKDIGTQWKGKEWLFTQWNGEIMNPTTPTAWFNDYLKKIGIKHRKFHSLRHTSATLLLYGGVNIKQVQARLGHSDIETTNKYLHLVESADEEATKALTLMLIPNKEDEMNTNYTKSEQKID